MPVAFSHAASQQAAPPGLATKPVSTYPSLREIGKWKPRHFFDDDWACAICDAISANDLDKLRRLIDGDFELDTTGKAGVTVLHWALFDDNIEAFKILLEAGADPDMRLTDFIRVKLHQTLIHGDTILFIALRKYRYNFFVAAFQYTKDPKQLDSSKKNLLLAYVCPGVSYDAGVVDAMVKGGVDMNATDRYDESAAHGALSWLNPNLCFELLKAGVDPTIRNKQGRSVGDVINDKIHSNNTGLVNRKLCQAIRDWLDAHSIDSEDGATNSSETARVIDE